MSRASGASGADRPTGRHEPAFPNTRYVARREYSELIRSRLFHVSTVVLATLAVIIALMPIAAKAVERGGSTRIAVVAPTEDLATGTRNILEGILNTRGGSTFSIVIEQSEAEAIAAVDDRRLDAVVSATRAADGRLRFAVYGGETIGDATIQTLNLGGLAVALLDYTTRNPVSGFQMPTFEALRSSGGGPAAPPYDPSAYASRVIVGLIISFLIFITIVIYGMWVAAGVVAEKSSRVMELLIGAASPRQLVIGKALGIGMAGATQSVLVLTPAVLTLFVEDRLATALLGPDVGISVSLQAISPTLFLAFGVYYALGFALFSMVYAAAGSLVSRPEDLQIIALPLSILAIAGYLQAIMAVTGGISPLVRFASYVPFWSPFVMVTRLSVGRVAPLEILVSLALLVVTIVVTAVIAIRIYSAGVLLYGQRPGLRAYVEAARRG